MKKQVLNKCTVSAPNDLEIVSAIQQGGPKLDKVLLSLYQIEGIKGSVFRYVLANNGNEQDADDVYQDGICAMILNIRSDKFNGDTSIRHYLFRICVNTWLKRLKRAKLNRSYAKKRKEQLVINYDTPDKKLSRANRNLQIKEMMSRCDPNARDVLGLWNLSYSFKEIAEALSLKNAAAARKIKFKALKKLTVLVHEYPDLMEHYGG